MHISDIVNIESLALRLKVLGLASSGLGLSLDVTGLVNITALNFVSTKR